MRRLDRFVAQLALAIGLFVLLWSLFNGPSWLIPVAAVVVIIDAATLAGPFWLPLLQHWWGIIRGK